MKRGLKLVCIPLLLNVFNTHAIDLVVVANTGATDTVIQKRQVRDIFMGNNSQLLLKPVALGPNSDARFVFNTKIVGLTESRIQSYWAQMRFSGRKKPPREFDSVKSMLIFVADNENTVGYMPADTEIPEGLTIIYYTD